MVKDSEAGFKLLSAIRQRDEYIPLIMQSAEVMNRQKAEDMGIGIRYVDKNSKKMNIDLRNILAEHFGFGDFIFRNPTTHEEVMRVRNHKELQETSSPSPTTACSTTLRATT